MLIVSLCRVLFSEQALEMMSREDVNQLPVVLNGSVAGIISRGDLLRLLQTRAELQTIRSG